MTSPGGAVELGVAYISLVPETRGFANAARDGIRDAQRTADQNPINLQAHIDVSNVQRDIDRLRGRTITQRVNLEFDRRGLSRLAGSTAAVSAGLAGIGGAAGAAGGAVGALGVGLAALGPAALAASATIAVGFQGVGDTISAITEGDVEKLNESMAKLSPNAQAFARAVNAQRDAFKELQSEVQDTLFEGMDSAFTHLATSTLPTLRTGMVDVARSMNGLTQQFAAFWAAPENLAGLESIFAGTANFIDGLGPGLQQATQGFLSMGAAAEPVLNKVGAQVGGMLGQIGQAFTDAANSGALTQLISGFGDVIQGLGAGLNPLIDGLIQAGNIIVPVLGSFLTQLGETIGAVAPSLAQLGATFLTALQPVLPVVGNLITALAAGLEPVLPVLSTLLQSVGNALVPLIGPMSQIAQVVGTALTEAINALAPAIGPIGEAFASLVTAVAPIIPTIATVASGLLQALAPALTKIFDALAPVIGQWTDLMIPVFEEIQPILAQVAGEIGTAIADALTQIAPLLPDIAKSFSGLLLAIIPLLPELVKLGTELLPPLIGLWVEMAPVMLKVIDAFTWLVNNVIVPLVIPALQKLSDDFTTTINTATSVVSGAKDFLGPKIEAIGDFFSDLGETVRIAWDGIVRGIAISVKKIGELLQKVPSIQIPGTDITIGDGVASLGDKFVDWATAHGAARGGFITGPGSSTSDSIPVMLSNGEFVVNASSTAKTLPLLEAINAGWVPSASFLHAMIPGFAEGGLVPGKKFATSMDSADYLMGGFSRSAIDCSAMVSAVVNDALGLDPFDSRMSTVNEGQWLAAKGALPGIGGPGDISVGWFDNGGGANGHTALTLGDGTNVESRSGDGVVIGGDAAGADDPMFDQHMHIPEKLLRGGDLGAGAGKGLGPNTSGGPGKSGGGTSGGGMKKSRQSAGGGASGTGGSGEGEEETLGAVADVFVTNWPSSFGGITTGGPASEGLPLTTDSAVPATTYGTDSTAPYVAPASPSTTTTPDSSAHPLASVPLPGPLGGLFQGSAPWYMASTPEQALANLGSQAGSLAQRGLSDVQGFFQDNWKEMLETGAGVLGMGAMGGGGNTTYNISGTDPMSAAAAVDRVHRRRSLATQRSGGFGR